MMPDIPAAAVRGNKKYKGTDQLLARCAQPGGPGRQHLGDEEHEHSADSPGLLIAGSQSVLVLAVKLPGVLHVFLV